MPTDETASTNSTATGMSVNWPRVVISVQGNPISPANGITANVVNAAVVAMTGAIRNTTLSAAVGMMAGQAAGVGSLLPRSEDTNWLDEANFATGFREAFKLAKLTLASGAAEAKLETWVAATREQ